MSSGTAADARESVEELASPKSQAPQAQQAPQSQQPPRGRFAISNWFRPVEADLLVYFRIVFGLAMLYWVGRQLVTGNVTASYTTPRIHFHYYGYEWVNSLPAPWMQIHFGVLGICAALIVVGCCCRLATLLVAMGFTYVFLIDKCLYLNHHYLICLLAWLLTIMPLGAAFSVDAWRAGERESATVPVWTIWLLRFQIGVPYFFGGIAKLNPDWLAGEPMRMMLQARSSYPVVGEWFTQEWCVQMFVWGGLGLDLLVVPGLLWARTRPFAYFAAVVFHLINAWLFPIGIFPWFMIFATVVFFPPGSIRALSGRGSSLPDSPSALIPITLRQRLLIVFLMGYVALQLVIPLRHFLQPGNPSWTEEGHYFAWHMMLRGKKCALRYYATDPRTNRTGTIDLRTFVTPFQLARCSRDPRMIHELALTIADDLRQRGAPKMEVRALSLVSLNGRKPQLMIDPRVDLAAEPVTYAAPEWIVPLREPLRKEPWNVPLSEWESRLLRPDDSLNVKRR